MDYYYSTSVATTPVKQIEALTTPVKKLRTPLVRTVSSPAFGYGGQPDFFTPMSRRDSISSFTSSIDSYPMTPVSEEFVAPDMLYRSVSQVGGRSRSSTAGSMSNNVHPYYPTVASASRMQRRHTHIGGGDDVPKMDWPAMAYYSSHEAFPLEYSHQHYPVTPSQTAAFSALHSGASTPMQHQLSSPLSEIGSQQLNVANHQHRRSGDVLPLIVSSMDKAHVCPHCNKRFKRLEHVKRHERSHTQEKPFCCSFENCGRFFTRSDNLKAHEKTHFKKGRNYRMMLKKMNSEERLAGGVPMSQIPSDEGLGASEQELEHGSIHRSSSQEVSSPDQYLAFDHMDVKHLEEFDVDQYTL